MDLKTCTKCGVGKPLVEFHKKTDSRDGLVSKCKMCVLLRSREMYESKKQKYRDWYKSNSERLRANYLVDVVKKREYQRVYRRNRSKSHPERIAELAKQHNSRHKGRANARTAKYYAGKTQATPAWANPIKIAAFYIEAARLTRETGVVHHVDHNVPLRSKLVCGLHCEFNLQVIPGPDNQSKSNRYWPDMP